MDGGWIDSGGGGVTNGGYSNPIDSTSQTPTNPDLALTYSNLPSANISTGLTQQHTTQHNMSVTEPTYKNDVPPERPPAYNTSDVPNGFPQAYSPSPMYAQPPQYPGQPSYPQPYLQQYPQQYPQQQQQQQVTVVGMQQTTPAYVVQPTPYQSYGGHIALACVTFWCCGVLFGLIAFILAVVADNNKMVDSVSARQYGRASIGISITGIVIGVVLYIAIGVAIGSSSRCYWYNYSGYSYRSCY